MSWLCKIFRKKLPAKGILLYGLQRSGTNYMETLLQLNYPDGLLLNGTQRNEITHKHFRLYKEKEIIPEPQFANTLLVPTLKDFEAALPFQAPDLYIIVSKDPYSWLGSYNKWSIKNNWPAHQHHYIMEYVLFYKMWMNYSREAKNILFVRYDDLLTDPAMVMKQIAQVVEWPELEKVQSTNKVYASRRFTIEKKIAHLSGDQIKKINPQELRQINEMLPENLMEFMGYKKLMVN
ncbi:MAG TPA: sulfotransferase domain-containing protein [Chitinophagales bacterium]|nr:sulfotransferase domain-containing protein [Chitinophagales bacterium]